MIVMVVSPFTHKDFLAAGLHPDRCISAEKAYCILSDQILRITMAQDIGRKRRGGSKRVEHGNGKG